MKKITFLLVFISIFGYSQTAITDANIQIAVDLWVSDPSAATTTYGDISDWDVSQVTDMLLLFTDKTTFNDDISAWDVSNVTNMDSMFLGATVFNQDIGAWDLSSVTEMYSMFNGATAFNQDISGWDVSNVTDMSDVFYQATAFNGDIGSWDVSSVTNMENMFVTAHSFNQDLGSWDVSSVDGMYSMFDGATAFNQDISGWDVSNVTDMSGMFYEATAFNQPLNNWDVSNLTDMSFMFDSSALSTDNYDNILIGWSQQALQSDVQFGAANINYCNGAAARQSIIDTYGWTITDADLDCATAGLEDENLLVISIYPNPTNNTLFITGNESPITVAIYNVLGKEVLSIKNTNNINLEALPIGVYVIRISDGVGQTNRKFIKN